jgi:hypothetical protein
MLVAPVAFLAFFNAPNKFEDQFSFIEFGGGTCRLAPHYPLYI